MNNMLRGIKGMWAICQELAIVGHMHAQVHCNQCHGYKVLAIQLVNDDVACMQNDGGAK